jgi:hypothetical protein
VASRTFRTAFDEYKTGRIRAIKYLDPAKIRPTLNQAIPERDPIWATGVGGGEAA